MPYYGDDISQVSELMKVMVIITIMMIIFNKSN